ncbi:MAG TPA: hypothetical protein VGZ22_10650 [Isosphaeraceae bacterium]|jgi:hypothetical protein|nr:hypothetical protein [Isosphaeraceae bacterium]
MTILPLIALTFFSLFERATFDLERIGRLEHPAIREASGIVQSRLHPGIFWVHNDSGNPPALFAVRKDGSLVAEFTVAVPNIDWEDIAIDSAGHLFVGEIGNNDNRLPLRAIYQINEPDPSGPTDKPLPVTVSTYYKFPPGGRFDAESLVIDGHRALVIAKTFDDREAEVFSVPIDPPAPLFKPAIPQKVARLPEFTEPATGADLSADGRHLAVCSSRIARVYEKAKGDTWTLIGQARYEDRSIEAICWDGLDLILASESRSMYRIREDQWRKREPAR